MYRIEQNNEGNHKFIKLTSPDNSSYVKIVLDQGASLQEFYNNNIPVIKELSPMTYEDTYASAILFPFANRVKDGSYNFNQSTYQLEINQIEENNALHGLVYNKTFELLNTDISEKHATVSMIYEEVNKSIGFPYSYIIQIDYTLMEDSLQLTVLVNNTDSKPFPFTLGWHPYFYSSDLYNSYLKFESDRKLSFDERMITQGIKDFENLSEFEIRDQKLDDCFRLTNNKIAFCTPEYNFELISTCKNNFLQIYTPEKSNTIAIEPTTGVSDSFNNNIGLQVLNPGETYTIHWEIKLIKHS